MSAQKVVTTSTPAAERKERDRLLRRNDILAAAETIFADHGFHETRMEQIAQAAGYAAGTIYLYFADKESLYAAIFIHKIEQMVAHVVAETTPATDPLDGLRRAVRAEFEFHDENRAFFDLFVRHRLHGSPGKDDPWSEVVIHYRRHFKLVVDLVERAQKQKLLRKADSHLLASALLGFIVQIARGAQREGYTGPLVKHTTFVCDLFLNGAKCTP
jgi:AcrR family transcriptional regulator